MAKTSSAEAGVHWRDYGLNLKPAFSSRHQTDTNYDVHRFKLRALESLGHRSLRICPPYLILSAFS